MNSFTIKVNAIIKFAVKSAVVITVSLWCCRLKTFHPDTDQGVKWGEMKRRETSEHMR